MSQHHAAEIEAGQRFAFGENWRLFLEGLTEARIMKAEQSLQEKLGAFLAGLSFVDVGCGSGLFSLSARRLGARVFSFTYDPASVACAFALNRSLPRDGDWTMQEGSAPRPPVSRFAGDVRHRLLVGRSASHRRHVGRDRERGGFGRSRPTVRRHLQRRRSFESRLALGQEGVQLSSLRAPAARAGTVFRCTVRTRHPARPHRTPFPHEEELPARARDVPWRDVLDWVGGYPYEYAKPEEIFDFYRDRGFGFLRLRTWAGGHGCNEFVFSKGLAPSSVAFTP